MLASRLDTSLDSPLVTQPETVSRICWLTTASSSTAPSTVNSLPRMHFMGWAARNSSQNSTSLMFFPSYQAGQPP